MNYQRDLYDAVTEFCAAGIPVGMVRLGWDSDEDSKVMLINPPTGWKNKPILTHKQVEQFIRLGCNAFLYALPDHVWVVDADTPDAVAWATQQFGEPVTHTRRGAHWLVYGRQPTSVPPGIDTAPRQLYGPASYYDTPTGVAVYTGHLPDFRHLPPSPAGHHEAPVPTQSQAAGASTGTESPVDTSSTQSEQQPTALDFFAPAPITQAGAMARARELLAAIASGPTSGADARGHIRDAAFFLGGLLHTEWFTAAQAREQVLAACAQRWGSASDADARWTDQSIEDGARKPLRVVAPIAMVGKSGKPANNLTDRRYNTKLLSKRPKPIHIVTTVIDTE